MIMVKVCPTTNHQNTWNYKYPVTQGKIPVIEISDHLLNYSLISIVLQVFKNAIPPFICNLGFYLHFFPAQDPSIYENSYSTPEKAASIMEVYAETLA
jgi:hypothetical protein